MIPVLLGHEYIFSPGNTHKKSIAECIRLHISRTPECQFKHKIFFFTGTWIDTYRGCNSGAVVIWPAVCTCTNAESKAWFVARTGKISLWLLYLCISLRYCSMSQRYCKYFICKLIQIQRQLNNLSRKRCRCEKVLSNIPWKYRNITDV